MEKEPQDNQHNHEAGKAELTPRIYVTSLSDYNDGRLFGRWIDANQTPEALYDEVTQMLEDSPMPYAEEWGIFDYEGFGPLRIDEYEDIRTLSTIAIGISEHGEAFAHWVDLTGNRGPFSVDTFLEAYVGSFESVETFAETVLEDLGYKDFVQPSLPEFFQRYVSFDIEGLARDLELSGDIMTSKGVQGVHIFYSRW